MTIDTNIESNTMSGSVLVTIVARKRKNRPKNKKAVALWNFPKSANIENSMTVLSYKILTQNKKDCLYYLTMNSKIPVAHEFTPTTMTPRLTSLA
jgi:hypothetical protein